MKQVIVIRKDLKMRRGKEIAQACHASMSFMSRRLANSAREGHIYLTEVQWEWLESSFKKVCLQVASEQELLDIEAKAQGAGLECHLVTDSGLTEFAGVPTRTCLAIGPDEESRIDAVTGSLKLY